MNINDVILITPNNVPDNSVPLTGIIDDEMSLSDNNTIVSDDDTVDESAGISRTHKCTRTAEQCGRARSQVCRA